MFLPLRTDSPLRSIPWANWTLIALNVLGLVLQENLPPQLWQDWALKPRDPQLIHYFTYSFLHAGWMHLASNLLFLYIFGNNINDRMGQLGYLAFYLAGSVVAGVGHVLIAEQPVIGASGAVSAVTGAYLVLLPRSLVTVTFLFVSFFEIDSFYLIAFFFLKDLVMSLGPGDGVAYAAHLGGTLFGAAISFALLTARLLPRDPHDVLAMLQRWNRRRQYRETVRQGYDPFAYLPEQDEPAPQLDRIHDLRHQINEALGRRNLDAAAELYAQLLSLDPAQVLPRQSQLDLANHLAHDRRFEQAALAYENFLRHHANYERVEEVRLMLGLIYARYLERHEPAIVHLRAALDRLRSEREVELARAELVRLEASSSPAR